MLTMPAGAFGLFVNLSNRKLMNTTEKTNGTYFEYLDALRCLAFLAVFYAHTGGIFTGATLPNAFPINIWTSFTVYGPYGVNFFFVLSGFLITYLLLKEKEKTGKVSIKNFYIKRILRIWPVYFITFFTSIVVVPFLISPETYKVFLATNPHMGWSTILSYLFFVGNFYHGYGYHITFSIGVLWSVCVEEQFYLVWPWIIRWFSVKRLTIVTVLIISLSFLYKYLFAADRLANYYLTWSVGMDLAFGALLGIFYFTRRQKQIVIYSLSIIIGAFIVIACAVGMTHVATSSLESSLQISAIKSSFVQIVRLVKTPIIDCLFTLILLYFINKTVALSTERSHPVLKFFHQNKMRVGHALTYLGKISYGLYAYHTICMMITVQILYKTGILEQKVSRGAFFATVISALTLTIVAAHLSSVFIEKKIMSYKNKLR
jgi:peptidoglycan/LPS O-acetylase OafA/YrhL